MENLEKTIEKFKHRLKDIEKSSKAA